MSFQVGIGSLGETVFFSGGTLYSSANYAVSYIVGVRWLSGCSEVGDHEICQKQAQVTQFYDM